MRRAIRLTSAIVATVSLAIPGVASAAAPDCGAEITEDVVLTDNLLECPGDGLVAAAAGITIDAGFHIIDGSGAGSGIRITAPDVTVRNATITDFQDGVSVPNSGFGYAWLADLRIAHNVRGVRLGDGNFPDSDPSSVTILASRIYENGAGVSGQRWFQSTLISDSWIHHNSGDGISFRDSGSVTVRNNRIESNDRGVTLFFASGSLDRNTIRDNVGHGVHVERGAGSVLIDNTVTSNGGDGAVVMEGAATLERNVFNSNGRDGLRLDDFNALSRPRYVLRANVANSNEEYGIRALQTGFTNPGGGANFARRNGRRAQCLNFACQR